MFFCFIFFYFFINHCFFFYFNTTRSDTNRFKKRISSIFPTIFTIIYANPSIHPNTGEGFGPCSHTHLLQLRRIGIMAAFDFLHSSDWAGIPATYAQLILFLYSCYLVGRNRVLLGLLRKQYTISN